MNKIRITFKQAGKDVETVPGVTIHEAATRAGLVFAAPCGSRGRCGKCLVRLQPQAPPATAEDKLHLLPQLLRSGYRLACRCRPRKDTLVEFTTGLELVPLSSGQPPTPAKLRDDYRGNSKALGLALDLGTTSVAAALYDLADGRWLATDAMLNAQLPYGADLLSRLDYCLRNKNGAEELRRPLLATAKALVKRACLAARAAPAQIKEAHVVGNTAMLHFFLGSDPRPLATYPFAPSYKGWGEAAPRDIGLSPNSKVICLPHLGGFVGADCLAVILATGMDHGSELRLAIDIGTNSEVALAGGGRILVTSAAAGPALEGGNISCGMRAAPGAIERVRGSASLDLEVIGGGKAKGLCGSGLIDLAAVLRKNGCLQQDGLLVKRGKLASRLSGKSGVVRLRLAPGLFFTQTDVRQLQLAKGAIAAAARTFLGKARPRQVFLAGAFGNYIDTGNALAIGLLPKVGTRSVRGMGNAALEGAALSLLSRDSGKRIDDAVRRTEHRELNLAPGFQDLFGESMALKPLP